MAKTVLLVATRKGLMLYESEDRRSWSARGPFCEGWPVYHARDGREPLSFEEALAAEDDRRAAGWFTAWQYRGQGFYLSLIHI